MADKLNYDPRKSDFHFWTIWGSAMVVLTIAAGIFALYMSGELEAISEKLAERYFKAKGKAEEKALEHTGSDKAQAFLSKELKDNPVVPNDEVDDVQKGLGSGLDSELKGLRKR